MSDTMRQRVEERCKDYDPATVQGRKVSLREFRLAAASLYDRLDELGENAQSSTAEDARTQLMKTLEGVLDASDCPQTMIGSF